MSAAKVQKIIDDNGVVVFSKSYCPYCNATKSTLRSLDATFECLELDKMEDGGEIQDALQELTKQRTVPNIFINHKHIGGNSDLQKLNTAQLKAVLKEAGAI
ncbi:hypothetical protein N7499_011365 [Penicillium canescens]|uniref:Glutaredoxin domain-containing protein n=1 Tax=Penicillium canescens TaxID=5083 RepID=A0AAD6IK05_PENCN|nr:uncharacterized protein N7446_006617 [Penicillium canescens]KAJ5990813.1 hypothetical protein N7522_011020 [Penicillium canescens]KAJ6051978.1 hypothetical protein N7460_002512 [Penicillium canescens]KAJ6062497.1 hypothetical protein N7446_006617 [Penicillium canescens]KAJ6065743.1 hypothetical protein N7444_001396 [Penicillium canescens]KAJ6069478.1 hypothetical protein N7499_011365 [Penicillium canescens]